MVLCVLAECLNTVSEDNQDAQAKMQELGIQLQQFLNSQSDDVNELLLRVLISGKDVLYQALMFCSFCFSQNDCSYLNHLFPQVFSSTLM